MALFPSECVILAGGLATRMRPLTEKIPKSLIEVGRSPFLEYQLQWLEAQRVHRVVLCVGHLSGAIREFASCRRSSLEIAIIEDGPELVGTGGAVARAATLAGLQNPFFVLYGDSFLPIPFAPVAEAFHRAGLPALMTVLKNEGRWDKSNATFDGTRVTHYTKRTLPEAEARELRYIDYGLSLLTPEALLQSPRAPRWDLALLFEHLSGLGQLAGHETEQRFYEIGSPAGLADFSAYAREAFPALFSASAPRLKS